MKEWLQHIESPISGGVAELQEQERSMVYRGENYTYVHRNYVDKELGIEFTTNEMDFENLEQIYVQYREKYNIPSPEEIKHMRERYGLSALKMSEVLGIGVNQYRRYEEGVMPTEAIGKMLRSVETPSVFLEYLRDSKRKFPEAEYEKICAKVQRSFLCYIKSKPDLSWFWELITPGAFLGKTAVL